MFVRQNNPEIPQKYFCENIFITKISIMRKNTLQKNEQTYSNTKKISNFFPESVWSDTDMASLFFQVILLPISEFVLDEMFQRNASKGEQNFCQA